jgi:hypothetical protein
MPPSHGSGRGSAVPADVGDGLPVRLTRGEEGRPGPRFPRARDARREGSGVAGLAVGGDRMFPPPRLPHVAPKGRGVRGWAARLLRAVAAAAPRKNTGPPPIYVGGALQGVRRPRRAVPAQARRPAPLPGRGVSHGTRRRKVWLPSQRVLRGVGWPPTGQGRLNRPHHRNALSAGPVEARHEEEGSGSPVRGMGLRWIGSSFLRIQCWQRLPAT